MTSGLRTLDLQNNFRGDTRGEGVRLLNQQKIFFSSASESILTLRKPTYFHNKQSRGGLIEPPPLYLRCSLSDLHENLHTCSIWPIFSEYVFKVKFYCLKTA